MPNLAWQWWLRRAHHLEDSNFHPRAASLLQFITRYSAATHGNVLPGPENKAWLNFVGEVQGSCVFPLSCIPKVMYNFGVPGTHKQEAQRKPQRVCSRGLLR